MTKWLCIEEIDNYPNYKYWKNDSAYYKYFPHNYPFINYFIKQIMLWIFYKKLKNKLSSKNVTNVIFIM